MRGKVFADSCCQQVFQVKKRNGPDKHEIYAMKVLKKVDCPFN